VVGRAEDGLGGQGRVGFPHPEALKIPGPEDFRVRDLNGSKQIPEAILLVQATTMAEYYTASLLGG